MVEEARLAGLKLILSLADNWKYPGGVDEFVDRSKTIPKRMPDQSRPADQLGDADLTASLLLLMFEPDCLSLGSATGAM